MAKRSNLVSAGISVQLRPGRYYRDPASGKSYYGPRGVPGSAKYDPGSGVFRIPTARWDRDVSLDENARMFVKADGTAGD